ncbi:polyprenyl synthetase family protein [Ketogulonicigenium vulgare]|uniref:Octaprenyl diphosphate synthase n=1 Tax=Ketogulonicigenium vulgare (strain WSH-001) TaxID=759362 RepID=F9Y8F3_KETVW|nr:polyprenyl synthetase family protein [Ketogulonicigenium vulgare]ADO41727.1 decaprenyl diphosphate synthase [Ketogulonicigenium vulgare Y25]AEM39962.1 Polyprenyl synthetase superfamily protein [Ketogulonicigenium vulgare WSH-001]ALJ80171.1 farnesyltranstransferase [Ketogulonicigenium vulgare]ANW33034.1 farnesyltranstransferase [Ketogulonicigenium vulgare]AOZ53658.1 decaprenyl diphosphate synthase [Ketogulonicigenium vulgare]
MTPHDRLALALADDLAKVNETLHSYMQSDAAPRIRQVSAHLIDAGGKRLRPMLTVAAARLCGYDGPHHIHLAATVEFIHTATLLHDDVVDDSKQRRGRPTANLLWDNMSSVLVGDYLFSRAFQLMTITGSMPILAALADASATIAEGEVLQLSTARDLSATPETYIRIARGKTAALFSAATRVGAMLAEPGDAIVQAMHDYGDALGIAFQIADDLLDYTGTDAIGKNRGDDLREGKLTLPVIWALDKADAAERAFWTRTIGKGDVQDGDFDAALSIMDKRGSLLATADEARRWAGLAKAALQALPPQPLRETLEELADYVVARLS